MSECVEPTYPGDDAPLPDLIEYFEKLLEYIECMENEQGGQPYAGICADISTAAGTAHRAKSKLSLVTTPPPPLPLVPTGTLTGLTTQLVAVSQDANAQDSSTQAGQTKIYQDLSWAEDWLKPASKTGTLAQLAGC